MIQYIRTTLKRDEVLSPSWKTECVPKGSRYYVKFTIVMSVIGKIFRGYSNILLFFKDFFSTNVLQVLVAIIIAMLFFSFFLFSSELGILPRCAFWATTLHRLATFSLLILCSNGQFSISPILCVFFNWNSSVRKFYFFIFSCIWDYGLANIYPFVVESNITIISLQSFISLLIFRQGFTA